MSTGAAIGWAVAVVLFLLGLLALGLCRAAGRGSRAEEAYAARRAAGNAPGLDFEAGRARLQQAIDDDTNQGEQ